MLSFNERFHIELDDNIYPWAYQKENLGYSDIELSVAIFHSWNIPRTLTLAIDGMQSDTDVHLNQDVRILKAATTLVECTLSDVEPNWDSIMESLSLKVLNCKSSDLENIIKVSTTIAAEMLPTFIKTNAA